MPLISVLIPVYNGEKTIRETIQSILDQTFQDFEIIAIDDGSTDSTVEIINQFQDDRIKVFSFANSGPNASRNRSLDRATGEYVSFIDADDLWTPNKLESQLKALQDFPKAAVAYSWTDHIDRNGQFLYPGPHYSFTGDVFAKLLLADFINSGSNPLIRKSAFVKAGRFDEPLEGGQDWDMWLRLAKHYPFAVVPAVQVFHRESPTSWSANTRRQEIGFNKVIAKALADAPESVQKLRRDIIGNRYKSLLVDALSKRPDRDRSLLAIRYLGIVLKHDPYLLRSRILPVLVLAIGIRLLLPSQQARMLLNRYSDFFDINRIFGYTRWST
ncbi:MAG: glycosyltransferase [Cyanobacteriota bacterium]|nr:glycosyltransferase [Cyanobacteriota bacterium]